MLSVFFLTATLLISQDLSPYFELVEQGDVDKAREEIARLTEQFPDNAGVMYLDALTTERAEDAVIAYRKLIQYHPASPYADDAAMKVGEYLYARGLYTQASREVKKLPVMYPKSEHLQRAVDLQISSLLATGERDSIDYYLRSYRRQFPELDLNYTFEPDQPVVQRPLTEAMLTPLSEGMKKPSLESVPGPVKPDVRTSQTVEEPPSRTKPKPGPVTQVSKPYVVQVGAYGSVENALRQKMRLEQLGYDVELSSITSRGKKLHAVQVVRYSTRAKAEKVGKKLKSDYGYGFLVLHRPE